MSPGSGHGSGHGIGLAGFMAARFAAAMDRAGPFEPRARLAVAVSGGADSMAVSLLAHQWASARAGTVLALCVDHGLRAGSDEEARLTIARLAARGLPGRVLPLRGLTRGPGLAARARAARYRALLDVCAAEGILHLLLGHHLGDQVETGMMRVLSASGLRGLAGMPAVMETRFTRLVRPVLDVPPGEIRAFLTALGQSWVEDPSNRDPAAQRARIRAARADPEGTAKGTLAAAAAMRDAGHRRAQQDHAIARVLAARATIHPQGYAILSPGPIEPEALAALVRTIGGAAYAPPADQIATLARAPCAATLGGVRLLAAGRLGPGWLLAREGRAIGGPVAVSPNALWDGRFRLAGSPPEDAPPGMVLAALGADAARFRDRRGPPAAVSHGLPAVRLDGRLIAAPHIGVGDPQWRLMFDPPHAAAGAPFLFG